MNDLVQSLQHQYVALQQQFDAVVEALEGASDEDQVTLEAKRNRLNRQITRLRREINAAEVQTQSQALQDLIQILEREPRCYPTIAQAYTKVRSSRFQSATLETVPQMVAILAGLDSGTAETRPLARFVAYVIAFLGISEEPPQEVIISLTQWASEHIQQFGQIQMQIETDLQVEREQQAQQQPGLLIVIRPDNNASTLGDQGEEYRVQAWFIEDLKAYASGAAQGNTLPKPIEWQDPESGEISGPEHTYPNTELETVFQAIRQACKQHSMILADACIHCFLPFELMDLTIDRWLLEATCPEPETSTSDSGASSRRSRRRRTSSPVCVGDRHPLVLRSIDRFDPLEYELGSSWQSKSQALAQCANLCSTTLFYTSTNPDPVELADLLGVGTETQRLGVHLKPILASLDQESRLELFEILLLETDLPLALWLRQEDTAMPLQADLKNLLTHPLMQLLAEIRTQRAYATGRPPDLQHQHLGSHLALLWDDARIRPPDLPNVS